MDNPIHVELRHRGGVRGVLPSWRKTWQRTDKRARRTLTIRLWLAAAALVIAIAFAASVG